MLLMKGKDVADQVKANISDKLSQLKNQNITLTLAILLVGDDPASHVYTNRLEKLAQSLGLQTKVLRLAATSDNKAVLDCLETLNQDPTITGILPMMPLPRHLDSQLIANSIAPAKDLDCLNNENIGKLYGSNYPWAPCTPRAVMETLKFYNIALEGKHVVVIGRSNVVGKPVANLLLNQNATVTICHSRTQNLAALTRQADIIVAAVGIAEFVKPDMVKAGVVIVDVGINQVADKLLGDVQADVQALASAFTPVPGGIDTVSTSMVIQALLKNYL